VGKAGAAAVPELMHYSPPETKKGPQQRAFFMLPISAA
jgi:hypothetical protein